MKLSATARSRLKPAQFAGPGRSYPVNDRNHAVQAKARAKQQLDAGKISKAQYDAIVAKANKVLGKSKKPSLSEVLSG